MTEDKFLEMMVGKPGNTMKYIREEMEFLGIDFTFNDDDSISCSIPEKYVLPDRDVVERGMHELDKYGSINYNNAIDLSTSVFPELCTLIFSVYDAIANYRPYDGSILHGPSIFETYINLKLNMLKLLNDNGHTPIDNTIQSNILFKLLSMFDDLGNAQEKFILIKPNIKKGVIWTPVKGLERLIIYMNNRDMVSLLASAMSDSKE